MREDWVEVELGEVCNFIGGGTPSKANPNFWNGILPWASIKDMKGDYLFETQDYITELGLKSSSTNLALPNEIILATRITPGKPIISTIKTTINQDLKVVKPKIKIDSKFLFYIFKSYEKDIVKLSSGTTVLGVNLNSLNTIIIPLAPLPIQRAIVQKIENYFELLDKGIADLKTAQEQLKIYRQAVLKKAFEGGFTATAYNRKDRAHPVSKEENSLPEGWKWVKLNEISKLLSGFAFKSSDFCDEGVPVIKIANIGYSEFVNKEQQYVPIKFLEENKDYIIYGNDLLIALTRPITNNTTKVCLYPNNVGVGLLNQRVACLKNISINKPYLFLFLQTNFFKDYIRSKFSETLQPNLSPKDLAIVPIPIPQSLNEQHAIVREIESRLSVCDKVEQSISESLEKAEALRQSILKKAFEGKLLSGEEIAQCKQEADYEPASVLLERIRKENKHGK
ncbi:MAG: restriction endonuclease subunit S [Bacteroidales bacterium]|jgi:type I restriction enzyme S subunit